MAPRKPKTTSIAPIALTVAALKACKCSADYHRLGSTTEQTIFQSAWNTLSQDEQNRITTIVNANVQPDPQAIADELAACGTLIELQAVKATYGEVVRTAWKLLPQSERDRLNSICRVEVQPDPESEISTIVETPEPSKRTLIELSEQLQQLDNLLDTIDGNIPVELQTVVDELLAQREKTHEAVLEKLDSYAALIQSRLLWAAARKAEAERLMKLAESDIRTVEFLKARLKAHLEATEQKKLRTHRFKIALCANGGKAPLRFNNTPPEQMPERFQRVTVEPDKEAIRTALEAGEKLEFAFLTERETHIRIK